MSLALAAVLCTAMVCGTYLAKRRFDVLEAEARVADAAAYLANRRMEELSGQLKQQQADLETLRAQVALRSL